MTVSRYVRGALLFLALLSSACSSSLAEDSNQKDSASLPMGRSAQYTQTQLDDFLRDEISLFASLADSPSTTLYCCALLLPELDALNSAKRELAKTESGELARFIIAFYRTNEFFVVEFWLRYSLADQVQLNGLWIPERSSNDTGLLHRYWISKETGEIIEAQSR